MMATLAVIYVGVFLLGIFAGIQIHRAYVEIMHKREGK